MTIDEAIKLLKDDSTGIFIIEPNPLAEAEKLGIEALKREKTNREFKGSIYFGRLPGETEE